MAFTEQQQSTLTAVVDTFLPSIAVPDDPHGFFALAGSAVGADAAVQRFLTARLPPEALAGLGQVLDGLAEAGFRDRPLAEREDALRGVAGSGPQAAGLVSSLRSLTLLFAFTLLDSDGRNPFWPGMGYPGPLSAPAPVPKTLHATEPPDQIDTDVVVVGSGSGGGVVAAVLAAAGRDVVVLEAGGYFNEADFNQQELWAYEHLFLHGGVFQTVDGNVTLAAGGAVGGGSTVNWSNAVRPPKELLASWAATPALADLATADFEAHVEAVFARICANDQVAEQNPAHQRLAAGAAALGYHYRRAHLNILPDRYDYRAIGYSGFGDQTGAKQGTMLTFLQDASDAGAWIHPWTKADRILVEAGRAAGVEATHRDPVTGASRRVLVRARQVVSACGALQTPALLLRSGIGGPAVGHHLHIHPVSVTSAVYDAPQEPWVGPGQAGIVDEFLGYEEGYGFLVEGAQHALGLLASVVPWQSGLADKQLLRRTRDRVDFICLVQDRGGGRVTIDDNGEAVYHYPFTDELDRQHFVEAVRTAARIQHAAGAEQIFVNGQRMPPWRRGASLVEFLDRVAGEGIGFGGLTVFSAHPNGSTRMGTDPAASVVGPTGELHDVPGVWIGDTGVFPTSTGVNPMVTCMAMARRTAHHMLRD